MNLRLIFFGASLCAALSVSCDTSAVDSTDFALTSASEGPPFQIAAIPRETMDRQEWLFVLSPVALKQVGLVREKNSWLPLESVPTAAKRFAYRPQTATTIDANDEFIFRAWSEDAQTLYLARYERSESEGKPSYRLTESQTLTREEYEKLGQGVPTAFVPATDPCGCDPSTFSADEQLMLAQYNQWYARTTWKGRKLQPLEPHPALMQAARAGLNNLLTRVPSANTNYMCPGYHIHGITDAQNEAIRAGYPGKTGDNEAGVWEVQNAVPGWTDGSTGHTNTSAGEDGSGRFIGWTHIGVASNGHRTVAVFGNPNLPPEPPTWADLAADGLHVKGGGRSIHLGGGGGRRGRR